MNVQLYSLFLAIFLVASCSSFDQQPIEVMSYQEFNQIDSVIVQSTDSVELKLLKRDTSNFVFPFYTYYPSPVRPIAVQYNKDAFVFQLNQSKLSLQILDKGFKTDRAVKQYVTDILLITFAEVEKVPSGYQASSLEKSQKITINKSKYGYYLWMTDIPIDELGNSEKYFDMVQDEFHILSLKE